MSIVIKRVKNGKKKYTAYIDSFRVSFGASGYSDYTIHKDANRMRNYVRRHGGVIPPKLFDLTDPQTIQNEMLKITRSAKEDWSDIRTAGFWSRWLLWSFPNIKDAKAHIEKNILNNKYKVTIQ